MPSIKLDHCVIHVSNWNHSNTFYKDVMGAEIINVNNGWAYRFGEKQLNCHGPNVQATSVARLPVMSGGSDLCFAWPGPIDDAIAHLKKHEVEIETGPVKTFGSKNGGTSVNFRDPDGSLLEFISYDLAD